jgi:hypothetical protein
VDVGVGAGVGVDVGVGVEVGSDVGVGVSVCGDVSVGVGVVVVDCVGSPDRDDVGVAEVAGAVVVEDVVVLVCIVSDVGVVVDVGATVPVSRVRSVPESVPVCVVPGVAGLSVPSSTVSTACPAMESLSSMGVVAKFPAALTDVRPIVESESAL